ncbi:MAG: PIN domain-containing protein [Bacteroidia bacterium]|nr:PIN domain-containing protein [Bacteroidia bacterium]
MIFDSSVWIDYLKGTRSNKTNLLDLQLDVYGQTDVHMCPPIFQEVLQGIRLDEKYELIRDLLFTSQFLILDPYYVSEQGSNIYRKLRSKGTTIRKPNDCLIAAFAIHFDLEVVHRDIDFDKIAKFTALRIHKI